MKQTKGIKVKSKVKTCLWLIVLAAAVACVWRPAAEFAKGVKVGVVVSDGGDSVPMTIGHSMSSIDELPRVEVVYKWVLSTNSETVGNASFIDSSPQAKDDEELARNTTNGMFLVPGLRTLYLDRVVSNAVFEVSDLETRKPIGSVVVESVPVSESIRFERVPAVRYQNTKSSGPALDSTTNAAGPGPL